MEIMDSREGTPIAAEMPDDHEETIFLAVISVIVVVAFALLLHFIVRG